MRAVFKFACLCVCVCVCLCRSTARSCVAATVECVLIAMTCARTTSPCRSHPVSRPRRPLTPTRPNHPLPPRTKQHHRPLQLSNNHPEEVSHAGAMMRRVL